MTDSKKDPSLHSSGALPSDDDVPISEPRPSLRSFGTPLPANDAPTSDGGAAEAVTRALTDAFLAKKTTQDRIRQVVEARAPLGTQEADLEDLVHTANEHVLTTTSLARSIEGMRAWVSSIAQNTVIDHCRANGVHLKWVDPSVDVQELPPDEAYDAEECEIPPDDPTAPPRPIKAPDQDRLLPWLASQAKTRADKATLEMIVAKAQTGKSNAEVAAEFGLSEDAFDARIRRFRTKWQPQWKRAEEKRNRAILLVVLFVVFVVAVAARWLLHRDKRVEAIRPDPVPLLIPVPSATVSAAPVNEPFNQALPPERKSLQK